MGQNKLNSFREEKKNGFRRSKYIFRLEINLEKNLDESFNPNIYSENPKNSKEKSYGRFGTREVQIKILEFREEDSRTLHHLNSALAKK